MRVASTKSERFLLHLGNIGGNLDGERMRVMSITSTRCGPEVGGANEIIMIPCRAKSSAVPNPVWLRAPPNDPSAFIHFRCARRIAKRRLWITLDTDALILPSNTLFEHASRRGRRVTQCILPDTFAESCSCADYQFWPDLGQFRSKFVQCCPNAAEIGKTLATIGRNRRNGA